MQMQRCRDGEMETDSSLDSWASDEKDRHDSGILAAKYPSQIPKKVVSRGKSQTCIIRALFLRYQWLI
jgi:hypothetical protein